MSGYGPGILPQHAKLLHASAITPEVASGASIRSAGKVADLPQEFRSLGSAAVPALVFPWHRANGDDPVHQIRPDIPFARKDGSKAKYLFPSGAGPVVAVHPGMRERAGDASVPILIVEGTKQYLAAVSALAGEPYAAAGIAGCYGWSSEGKPIPDLALVPWDRDVYLCFDADVGSNRNVWDAAEAFTEVLTTYGARSVRYIKVPGVGTAGLDDVLGTAGDPATVMKRIIGRARDKLPRKPAARTPRKEPHTRTPEPEQAKQVCAPDEVCAHTPPLATKGDLLAEAVGAVHELGVAGEDRIIRGTFLTAVSQVLAEPISLVVKGSSAGGKSYSTRTTLRLFPGGDPDADEPSDFYMVTAGSQRSLIYTDEEFTHRTIVMFEATALREVAEKREGDMTAMLVRTLLSEGRIVYDTTERGDDGKMTGRRITKKGPTNLIVTTTADNLHHENETRLLSLTVDESEEHTRAVLRKIAGRRNQAVPAEPPDLTPWHALFHWLKHHGQHRVYIPYADYLSETAAASVVRMRRDFGVLLGMIEAHAVLHQATRQRDGYQRIIATDADYQAARDILADAFAITSGKKVKEVVRKAVAAVEALGGRESDVTVAQVAKHLKRDRTRASRGLKEAADLGYLTNEETREGRAARYRLGHDAMPADKAALPDALPDDAPCASTPAQGAQVSPQVSEGCAPVRVCAGGAADSESSGGDDTASFYSADEGDWSA